MLQAPTIKTSQSAARNLGAQEVAQLLREIGRRALLEGGNPYKAKAYLRAADSLRALMMPLAEAVERDKLKDIPGVGDVIAQRITNLHRYGTDPGLERLRKNVPESLPDLLAIPRLTPTNIVKLHKLLGITSIEELEKACRQGKLQCTKGLGLALQKKILQGIELASGGENRLRMNRAQEVLEQVIAELRASRPELNDFTIAGDLRRGCDVISDLALVATSAETSTIVRESTRAVSLYITPADRRGLALLHATGNAAHVAGLEAVARSKGFTLALDGLGKGANNLRMDTERVIYKALGLAEVPPELREGADEITLARRGKLPKLVRQEDLKGLLHIHTTFSDGMHTLEEMAEAARSRGYRYLGISDHSQSAHYAGGLSVDAIVEQHRQIDSINRRYRGRFCVLKGIESDIRPDGSLDYADDVLERFDFVVASVHSLFKLDRKAQTQRMLAAIANPYTTILGHPTGRLLLRRPGYEVDMETILTSCAKHGVAIEVNCNPNRLELDWRWHRRALELGCWLSIDPDAHSIRELDLPKWGVAIARKGGVSPSRVLNCLSLPHLQKHFRKHRDQTCRRLE
jgi:DNA polymerase (family X)